MNFKPIIIVPKDCALPTELPVEVIKGDNFIQKLVDAQAVPIAIVELSSYELEVLIKFPQVFGLDMIALVGVPGGRYDTVWSTQIAPLKRVSIETLPGEVEKIKAAVPTAPDSPIPPFDNEED